MYQKRAGGGGNFGGKPKWDPTTDPSYKTELCWYWLYGSCAHADKCLCAHTIEELRECPEGVEKTWDDSAHRDGTPGPKQKENEERVAREKLNPPQPQPAFKGGGGGKGGCQGGGCLFGGLQN